LSTGIRFAWRKRIRLIGVFVCMAYLGIHIEVLLKGFKILPRPFAQCLQHAACCTPQKDQIVRRVKCPKFN